MSLLDTYKRKLEVQIEEHKAHLDILKAKAKQMAAQSKVIGHHELAQADKHFDQVKAKFQQLKGAGGSALADLRIGVKNALADLKASSTKAAKHFDTPPPKAKARHRARPKNAQRSGQAKATTRVKTATAKGVNRTKRAVTQVKRSVSAKISQRKPSRKK